VVAASSSLVVSAPGKLMISGEYAVLHGAPAVVAAVDRRAFVRLGEPIPGTPVPAEARAAYAQAAGLTGETATPALRVDVASLRSEGAKLGLVSSAAAAAAAAGLAFAVRHESLESPAARRKIFDAAWRGHRAISPQGSGADVAASVHGGVLRFWKPSEDAVAAEPVEWPAALRARVVWTGQEARTSSFLEKVAALASADPSGHRTAMNALSTQAERFVAALIAKDINGLLASTEAYGHAMGELGEAAGVSIVTEALRKVASLASRAGGAAKPSGAGGGDVALALFPDLAAEQRFELLCQEYNFALLSINLGAPGVRIEAPVYGGEEA
jgi:phosphomevalonate kinase